MEGRGDASRDGDKEHSRRQEIGQFSKPWKERSAGLVTVGTVSSPYLCSEEVAEWKTGVAACTHRAG